MIDPREDQAAGLRRLFRRAPPSVVALYAAGRRRAELAVEAARRLAAGARVLLVDEAPGADSLAAVLGLPPGSDLLNALDGRIAPAALVQPVAGLAGRVPAAAAALALPLLDDDRRARLLEILAQLQRQAGFVLVHAGARAEDPSPFALAAPHRLVVAEASASGATEAYALVKALAACGAGSVRVAVGRARGPADARAFFAALDALVDRHVGLPLAWAGELERDDLAAALVEPRGADCADDEAAAFLRRLATLGRRPLAAPAWG